MAAIQRCTEVELLILEIMVRTELSYDSADIAGILNLSSSAASHILHCMSDCEYCKKHRKRCPTIELLHRSEDRIGAHGSYIYSSKEGLLLEDIQKTMTIRRYSLESHLAKQNNKYEKIAKPAQKPKQGTPNSKIELDTQSNDNTLCYQQKLDFQEDMWADTEPNMQPNIKQSSAEVTQETQPVVEEETSSTTLEVMMSNLIKKEITQNPKLVKEYLEKNPDAMAEIMQKFLFSERKISA